MWVGGKKMKRRYTNSINVGRPVKYGLTELRNIINKTKSDEEFAKMYNVSIGTIHGIRCNQSRILKIPIKDKWKNSRYGVFKPKGL